MTETALSKVSLIDEFKELNAKQWLAIAGAFAACALLVATGLQAAMCMGFLLVAVILYMIPHIAGVTSPKIKAVVGVVFIIVLLLVGTFCYNGSVINKEMVSTAVDPSIELMYYEDGIITVVSSNPDLDLDVLTAPVSEMCFGQATNYDRSQIKIIDMVYEDGIYTASPIIIEDCYQLIEVALDMNGDDTKFTYYYMIYLNNNVSNITELSFYGAGVLMAMIGGVYFIMLIFSELMRRSARKTRDKMEKDGRLYPQGYSKCKECGTMVLPGEITCRKCGAPIEVPDDVKVLHKKDFFECSECGTEVPMDAKVCPKCGAKFDEDTETEIQHADGTVDVSNETFECSECGKTVPANAKRCPYCGAEFDEDDE